MSISKQQAEFTEHDLCNTKISPFYTKIRSCCVSVGSNYKYFISVSWAYPCASTIGGLAEWLNFEFQVFMDLSAAMLKAEWKMWSVFQLGTYMFILDLKTI